MSRVSRKSELSPSVTRGSNGIDLGKNSGVDMGQKSQPSVTSGGIGVTQEITSVGDVNVSAGANIDITPLDFGININPSEGTVAIATGAEIPGGILGVSGGIEVDLNTGETLGLSIGGEALGLGINVSNSKKGGLGIEFTVQIPGTPIELSLGFGFPPKVSKDPKDPKDSKDPKSIDTLPPRQPDVKWTPPGGIDINNVAGCTLSIKYTVENNRVNPYAGLCSTWLSQFSPESIGKPYYSASSSGVSASTTTLEDVSCAEEKWYNPGLWEMQTVTTKTKYKYDLHWKIPQRSSQQYLNEVLTYIYFYIIPHSYTYWETDGELVKHGGGYPIIEWRRVSQPGISVFDCQQPKEPNIYTPPTPRDENVPPSPFPNPPPRRQNKMDECCRESIKLQRLIVRHLGAERNTPKEDLPDGVTAIGSNREGINQAFPFSVKKQWINPTAKENEKIQILNDRQLALVLGGMIERLERTLGTAEFYKDSDKKLRQSEDNMLSWLTGKNKDFRFPDPNDFWLNSDDGVINEKVLEIRSIADGLRYQIEALNRLERILPIAELKDSSIPARWIYPNGKGQLRVGNLIHLCEYMIRKSDKDMGYWPQKITIKAANPAIKDDEPITADVNSVGDMLRVMMQQIVEAKNDGDTSSNYDLRRTYLDVMAFQMLAKNNKYLQAITEYLSFDMTEEVSNIPIPFDPFAGQDRSLIENWWIKFGFGEEKNELPTINTASEIEELSGKLLQNSELEVSTVKFGSPEAKKDPKTLKEALIEILKHSSASAAAVTEVASEGALDRIVDAAGLAQRLTSFLMRRDIREALGIGDLDNWISSAEKGYTDNLETESLRFPESNPFEPYGRPATQNPVIREIDTKEDKAD